MEQIPRPQGSQWHTVSFHRKEKGVAWCDKLLLPADSVLQKIITVLPFDVHRLDFCSQETYFSLLVCAFRHLLFISVFNHLCLTDGSVGAVLSYKTTKGLSKQSLGATHYIIPLLACVQLFIHVWSCSSSLGFFVSADCADRR